MKIKILTAILVLRITLFPFRSRLYDGEVLQISIVLNTNKVKVTLRVNVTDVEFLALCQNLVSFADIHKQIFVRCAWGYLEPNRS